VGIRELWNEIYVWMQAVVVVVVVAAAVDLPICWICHHARLLLASLPRNFPEEGAAACSFAPFCFVPPPIRLSFWTVLAHRT